MPNRKIKKISILLCAYNAEVYIADAISSTLAQSYHDFDFIIVDDGSTDHTLDIINSLVDCRIKVVPSAHNYIGSLNLGLKLCEGEYIARMDADDIMEPSRLEEQVKLMEAHQHIAVCTSWAQTFGKADKIVGNIVKGEVNEITTLFLLGNFLMHPSSVIRRKFLTRHRIKYKDYLYAEDFKLWTDIAWKGGGFYVIPKPLIRYRITDEQVTNAHRHEQNQTRLTIQQEIIEKKIKRLPINQRRRVAKIYHELLLTYQDGAVSADSVVHVMFHIFNRINLSRHL